METKILAAYRYIELGWPVFVLGNGKTPIANCTRCDSRRLTYIRHDAESCECLTCHGFYAATLERDRVTEMLQQRPSGLLAVRTGGASRLMVIDAEATAASDEDDDITGLDVIDAWEEWTNLPTLPKTLRQRSGSGGLHIVFRTNELVGGHNRVLPQVDIKAESGYIIVADGVSEPGRRWLDPIETLVDAPEWLTQWANEQRKKIKSSGGYGGGGFLPKETYERAKVDGARSGEREPFFAQLSFELRKNGVPEAEIVTEMYDHWTRCEQSPGNFFHWSYVEYKIERDRNIVPDVTDAQAAWASRFAKRQDVAGVVNVGRVTMTGGRR